MPDTGLGGQLVVAKETTFGTRVVPNRSFEFNTESLKESRQRINARGIRAGRMFQRGSRSVQTTRDGGGDIVMDVPTQGFGPILDQLHGNAVTPVVQGATIAYKQTHDIGNTSPRGKSLSVQVGRPDTGGIVRPFDYLGLKVTSLRLAVDTGGLLVATIGTDSREEKTDQTLVTPSYPATLRSFNFTQGSLLVDTVAAAGITSVNMELTAPMKTDRFFLNSAGLKAEPLSNDYAGATVNVDAEFQDLTLYSRYRSNTKAALDLLFTGEQIATGFNETLRVLMDYCVQDGDTPNIDGPDVLNQSIPFVVQDGATLPPVRIEYTSLDAAL
ncbi:MAG: phage tail tube protein [Solirubrobacteraceae bacterium]